MKTLDDVKEVEMSDSHPPSFPVRRSARDAAASPEPAVPDTAPTRVAPASFPPAQAEPPPTIPPRRASARPLAVDGSAQPPQDEHVALPYREVGGYEASPLQGAPPPPRPPRRPRRHRGLARLLVALVVLALIWPVGLYFWANSRLTRVEALSRAEATPGTTWLIAGSDARGNEGVEGTRADTIMVLNSPPSGRTALMSLPRDTYVAIPGHGKNKINAAFAIGGPALLVKTVERLTGLTIDHYVEVRFSGVVDIVDAVGGVELCLDKKVKDRESKLSWKKGCHMSDGETALAFSRMRKQDPLGDIGRAMRQRQVVGAVMRRAVTPATFVNPVRQVSLLGAATSAVVVDEKASVIDLARLAFAFKRASGPGGATGVPTIADIGFNPGGGVGSTVRLDEKASKREFADMADGTWEGTDLAAAG